MTRDSNRLLVLTVAYLAFIVLGASSSLLGVATPSIQSQFNLTLAGIFPILLAGTSGYLISSFVSGPLAVRLSPVRLFMIANVLSIIGLFGTGTASSFWLVVISSFITGLGNGTVDGGINAYMAAHY